MRLIERQMNKAILNSENWKSDNTEVIYSPERDASYVYLHGNSCGYKTKTTKSRLNAILSEHGNGARIFQRNFEWVVIDTDNNDPIPFTEGMILN
jgi:hypothetical protein